MMLSDKKLEAKNKSLMVEWRHEVENGNNLGLKRTR